MAEDMDLNMSQEQPEQQQQRRGPIVRQRNGFRSEHEEKEECLEPTIGQMLLQQVLNSVQVALAIWAGFILTEAMNRQLRSWEPAQRNTWVWWALALLILMAGAIWALIPRPKHSSSR